MFRVNRFPALLALSFALLSSAQQPATSPQAQATSAPDYMKQAEQRLSDAAVRASRASWVQETYITDDTEAIAAGREELREVIANLEHLSEDRREALIMRFALGMDNREIARALGRTDGATKVLIHRAIRQLQEEMSDERGE